MKIDIHTHTKKCKSGDAPTREISPEDFCEVVQSTEVKIIAVTNHNLFDQGQYDKIRAALPRDAQVWPGIELDVLENGARGHLLVIVSPKHAKRFSEMVVALTRGSTPDNFTTTIEHILQTFDALGPIYVAHYKQKTPNISDEALEKLLSKTHNRSRVIKEVTNSISAGIYISHGHASIYGSDVHDWAKYEELSRELPDLRLPVESFEHFCLLLEKDPTAINTLLDKKTSEELVLNPFDGSAFIKMKVFNDIHVIFGPKGTGKTCILKAIAKHYSENGVDAKVYEPASDRLDELFDIKGKELSIDLNRYSIKSCTTEIEVLRNAVEADVTSLNNYVAHFDAKSTNRNAKKILIKNIDPEKESGIKREFLEFNEAAKTIEQFITFLSENSSTKREFNPEEIAEVTGRLSEMLVRMRRIEWRNFSEWKATCLLNSAIRIFRKEVERKTGTRAKPTTTGFREYAMNRVKIEVSAAAIIRSVETQIPVHTESVGTLDSNKGKLEFRTEFKLQSGSVAEGEFSSFRKVKKGVQKKFMAHVRQLRSHAYSNDLFQEIAELNEVEDVEDIKSVSELLLFKRYFALDGEEYSPSSGEASMVMLQKELGAEKDVYILDEPERSLGNEYINDVIVPLIKERARAGKKLFISTHDANIAVRTLPYSSIYRCHGSAGYKTYIGNPFSNNLVNPEDSKDQLDWKKVSMRTLEGGEEAFGERGNIYGNA